MKFSIITASLKNSDKFLKAVEIAEAAHTNGIIPNPIYNDIKAIINRRLSEAWSAAIQEIFTYSGRYLTLPPEVREFEMNLGPAPELHTVIGKLKKVNACKLDHPMIEAMKNILEEMAPLATIFADLKGMISKRQPKPVEDRKEKYNAPGASKTVIGHIKKMFEEVTEKEYLRLTAYFEKRINTKLQEYLDAQEVAITDGKQLTLNDYYYDKRKNPKSFSPQSYILVERFLEHSYNKKTVKLPNAEALIAQKAVDEADEIRDNFVYKNLNKISSVIETKGDFERAVIVGSHVDLGGLTGSFKFFFKDGANFVVNNSVVWSHSIYDKSFQRFPLTFHDVFLSGNVKMARPSEERMNTIFVGK